MPLDNPLILPQNIEAEQGLLAAILARNATYESVAGILKPEHFADGIHSRMFGAIEREIAANRRVSPITLANDFDRGYLAQLAGSTVTLSGNREYAHAIFECWQRRELLSLSADIKGHVETPAVPMEELREAIDSRFSGIFAGADERTIVSLSDLVDPTIDRIQEAWRNKGKLLGITTGLADLDSALGGLVAGELYILAGRPGMGKSTAAKTTALAAARHGHQVVYFSLEMSVGQLTQWCLADLTGISAARQRSGEVNENDIARLVDAGAALRALPLMFDDRAALSMGQIRAQCRRVQRGRGLGLIVVDHIGLIAATREARRMGAVQAMTEITGQLKQLAKDLAVPVLALSQLNRAVEGRDDKRPGLADLRDSGSIEQDADVVIMAYREEYYLRDEPEQKASDTNEKFAAKKERWHADVERCKGLADLIIAKHRSGPNKTVKVRFEPDHSRMSNFAYWGG